MTNQLLGDTPYYQAHYSAALDPGSDVEARRRQRFLEWLELKPGDRVMDLGSGLGVLAAAMSDCGAQVVGVDASPVAVAEAQQRYPQLTLLAADGLQLDRLFSPASFDAITCIQVLEHVPPNQVDDLIGQFALLLRHGGRLLIDVPITDNLSDRWLVLRNQHLRGMRRPPGAIDSSFNPTHLWKIGDLDRLIDRFTVQGLQPEKVRRLYYVPWLLDRLGWGRAITHLPGRWMEQLLKGATLLFRKGAVDSVSRTALFSAFWSDPPGTRGLARLKKLLA